MSNNILRDERLARERREAMLRKRSAKSVASTAERPSALSVLQVSETPRDRLKTTLDNIQKGVRAKSVMNGTAERGAEPQNLLPSFGEKAGKMATSALKGNAGNFVSGGGAVMSAHGGTEMTGIYDEQIAELKRDREIISKQAGDMSLSEAERKMAREQLDIIDRRLAVYEPALTANKEIGGKLYEEGNKIQASSQADAERAKQGLGKVGSTLVDAGIAGIQMAGDFAASALTGGAINPLTVTSGRVFGSAAQEAKNNGATDDEAAMRGILSALTTYGISKLSSVSSISRAYAGKGAATDWTEKVAGKLAEKLGTSAAGKTAVYQTAKLLASGAGEAIEEMLEDVADPVLDAVTYRGVEALSDYGDTDYYAEMLYDGLIGGIMGLAGGGIDVAVKSKSVYDGYNAGESAVSSPEAAGGEITAPKTERVMGAVTGLKSEAASAGEAAGNVRPKMTMADFSDNSSPVWNIVSYEDNEAKRGITQSLHDDMVSRGRVAVVPESTQSRVSESFPDLRAMSKGERTPILKEKMSELKSGIRNFLNGLKGSSFEFEVNGNILDAKLYDTGVREVMGKIGEEKAAMLYHSDGIFRNAEYLYSTPDYEGNPNIYRWNYFYSPVQIGEDTLGVRIAVRDMVESNLGKPESQIYNWGIKKNAPLDGGSPSTKPPSSGVSSDAFFTEEAPVAGGRHDPKAASPDNSLGVSSNNIIRQNSENSNNNLPRGTGAAEAGFDPFSHLQNQSGEFHKTGENPARTVEVPVKHEMGFETSKGVQTALEAEATPDAAADEIQNAVVDGKFSYLPVTDKAAKGRAEETVRHKGFENAVKDWTAQARAGKVSKDLIVLGQTLYNNAVNSGDTKGAVDILADLVGMSRTGAQATQANRVLKTLSPEYQLYALQRSVQHLNDELSAKLQKRGVEDISINKDLAKRYLDAQTDTERNAAMEALKNDVAAQVPSSWYDRWNAWRYLSMLGNPRTHIRNIVGNAGFAPVRSVKNVIAAGIEGAAGIENKSKALLNLSKNDRGLIRAAWTDYGEVSGQIMSLGKFDNFAGDINSRRQIFKTGLLEGARSFNGAALDAEDVWFAKPAYAFALAGWYKAHGVTAEQLAEFNAETKPTREVTETPTPRQVFEKASKAQAELDETLSEAAAELGISFEAAPQKSIESMTGKAARKRAGGESYGLLDMKDHARGKLELPDFNRIPDVLRFLDEKNIPYSTETIGPTEWGYRGFHVTWRNAEGIGSELQITRPDVWKVKLESDRIYDKWRGVNDLSTLNEDQRWERAKDRQHSIDMWAQLNLPDFKSWESSVSDSLRALNSSSEETGRNALTHLPSKNSKISPPLYQSENSSTRPDSVKQAIEEPPLNDKSIIAENDKNSKGTAGERLTRSTVDAARAYAIREAQRATYRDSNAFSDWVSKLGKYHGDSKPAKAASVFVEGVLPFKRTPANILARAVDYSPIGLVKGLTYDLAQVHKGNMEAWQAIDSISAGLTGTGLLGLGAYLASQGILSGGGGDDKEKALDALTGRQDYALNIGGKSITLDWLAPEALPLFVGVELYGALSDKSEDGISLTQVLDKLGGITDPMFEMSMLQGVNDLFESVKYSDDKSLVGIAVTSAVNYLSQGLPTLFGQIERIFEPERKSTFIDKNSGLPQEAQYMLGKLSGKVPFWEYNQIPYRDALGNTQPSGSVWARAANNLFNPAYIKGRTDNAVTDELGRLNDKNYLTGIPEAPEKKFSYAGEEYILTAPEYELFQKTAGESSYKLMLEAIQSSAYKSMTDTERNELLQNMQGYAGYLAKKEFLDKKGVKYEPDDYRGVSRAAEAGIDAANYYIYDQTKDKYDADGTKSLNTVEFAKSVESSGLSKKERSILWAITYPEWPELAKSAGVEFDVYTEYKAKTYGLAADKDENGKSIDGTKKAKVLDVIDGLDIPREQKDALYLGEGYTPRELWKAPWNLR